MLQIHESWLVDHGHGAACRNCSVCSLLIQVFVLECAFVIPGHSVSCFWWTPATPVHRSTAWLIKAHPCLRFIRHELMPLTQKRRKRVWEKSGGGQKSWRSIIVRASWELIPSNGTMPCSCSCSQDDRRNRSTLCQWDRSTSLVKSSFPVLSRLAGWLVGCLREGTVLQLVRQFPKRIRGNMSTLGNGTPVSVVESRWRNHELQGHRGTSSGWRES